MEYKLAEIEENWERHGLTKEERRKLREQKITLARRLAAEVRPAAGGHLKGGRGKKGGLSEAARQSGIDRRTIRRQRKLPGQLSNVSHVASSNGNDAAALPAPFTGNRAGRTANARPDFAPRPIVGSAPFIFGKREKTKNAYVQSRIDGGEGSFRVAVIRAPRADTRPQPGRQRCNQGLPRCRAMWRRRGSGGFWAICYPLRYPEPGSSQQSAAAGFLAFEHVIAYHGKAQTGGFPRLE
jgi:hypothetical protein